MNTTLLIMAILVVILPTAMLTSMFLLKSGGTHSERMAREQEQLDRKNGIAPRTHTASENAGENKKFEWIKLNVLTILVVIGGAIALYWGFNTQMRPADVGSWSYGKWLPLLIFWGIGAALIALNAKEKTAVTLQKVLTWVMLVLLIALPLWSWIATPTAPTPQQATRSEIPLASSPQSTWPKWVIPAGGKSERIPVPPGMRIVMAGNKFLLHNVYRDGNECAFNQSCPDVGAVAGNYATNEAQETNIVAYAFAPI